MKFDGEEGFVEPGKQGLPEHNYYVLTPDAAMRYEKKEKELKELKWKNSLLGKIVGFFSLKENKMVIEEKKEYEDPLLLGG